MFKQAAFAVAAAAAVVAAPATAATVVYTSGTNVVLAYNASTDSWDGAFEYRVENFTPGDPNGNFTANLTFTSPINGLASATAGNVRIALNNMTDLNFTGANLNGNAGIVMNVGGASSAWVFDVPVAPGVNNLSFSGILNPSGNRTGDALVTGSVVLAAVVPEPATWGLFILGFGAIGGVMRRRSQAAKIAKASLTFA